MAKIVEFLADRRGIAVLIGGGALLLALIIGSLWVVLDGQNGGETNPTLIDSNGDGPVGVTDTRDNVNTPVDINFQGGGGLTEGEESLQISLSEGQPVYQGPDLLPVTVGEPLTDEEIRQVLARLPDLPAAPEDQLDFQLPEQTIQRPQPGETIEEEFPALAPEVGLEQYPEGPLEVLRYSPEGEIPIAPFVNVTFNQPMVSLDTLESLSAEDVPVQLEPNLPGTWKWLGTKILSFEFDSAEIDRLPKATQYVVTIPAGTQSATSGVLAETVSWTFSTPPPVMVANYPAYGPQQRDPVFVVGFDQRIDPQAVLNTIQVTADGKVISNIRLATEEELAADMEAQKAAERVGQGRWLAFVSELLLPADAAIVVTVGPGTPSAEGPLVTASAQSYEFRTYAPLRIEDHGCSWYSDECPPLSPFFIRFNNPIDADAYQESMVLIEPELPGALVEIMGNSVSIRGRTSGRTTYQVTVDGAIQDSFGQTLGQDEQLRFKVGSAEPALFGPDRNMITLDPAASRPVLTVYAVNYSRLKVRAYRVEPSDWKAYQIYLNESYYEYPPDPPGELVIDETVPVEAADDVLTEVNIDLSQGLEEGLGHLVVVVEPSGIQLGDQNRYRRRVKVWVQATQIGLDAYTDHSDLVVWTTSLQDGASLVGVSIETIPDRVSLEKIPGQEVAVTGQDGTATYGPASHESNLVIARQGDDLAFLTDVRTPYPDRDSLRWYVFDDRAMYRPGEEVHVKGWLRGVGGRQDGDLALPGSGVQNVHYQVVDPYGNEMLNDSAPVNTLGGFDFVFTLPTNINLGYALIRLNALGALEGVNGREFYHRFQVQEFRRPEFEVTVQSESVGPYFVGDHAMLAVSANYYAGGPLPNAEVTWHVSSSPSSYSPPNWSDFVFGTWTPWWYSYEPVLYDAEYYEPYWPQVESAEYETFSGITDAAGKHYLRLDFDEANVPRPFSVMADATVMDVNRQAWASSTSLLVHPAELYVGLRSDRTFVQKGTPLDIELVVTDLEGNPVPDRPITVLATRLEWKYGGGSWHEEQVDLQECTVGSGLEPVTCSFETAQGGEYQITAVINDQAGRQNQSQFTRWVSGGRRPASRKVEQETATLVPDKEEYQPGDVAQILVQAPFSSAEGLLTVARSGRLYSQRFTIEEDTITLQVPIEEAHIPNLHLQVDLVGAAPRTDDQGEALDNVPARPAFATGQLNLEVPPLKRTLSLEVTPQETELEPGGVTTLDVRLVDASGEPVPDAELAVVVVDEAILALSNYELADPVAVFYRSRPIGINSRYGRDSIVLANPESLAVEHVVEVTRVVSEEVVVVEEAEMMVADGDAVPAMAPMPTATPAAAGQPAEPEPIKVRSDFNPLATFAPTVRTDGSGRAAVEVSLPDNLTRYRVMVVAVAGDHRFGSGEANLTARLPLMVRPSAPRFLNFGDCFELPVVLQNQTDQPLAVELAVQAANLDLTEGAGRRVMVPANDRIEVRFPATTVMAGTARLQFAAVAGSYADAATVELPVFTPATTEAFAVYGVVDEGAIAQPVASPQDVYPQFGGLEISTSSTALQSLTDAVLYLTAYRYECSEQLASRILAVAALRDVLTAFSAEGLPSPAEMEYAVQRDIEKLQGLQNWDGGFPYWERGKESVPFNTIHVAHALQRAQEKGFEVPPEMLTAALEYLRQIENYYPSWYSDYTRQTLSAYAVYVRDLMGDTDVAKAQRLLNETGIQDQPLEALAWLWQVLFNDPNSADMDAIRQHFVNRAVETAGAANFTSAYNEQDYLLLNSNRRTDAIILDAMIAGDNQSDLIPKLVNGLLAHRTKGRWRNTQENVFVLLALDRYFNTFEAQTPEFVARIWLGDTYVGDHAYVGRTTERHETTIPMSYLTDAGATQDLIMSKEGPGRLYYRLGLRYAPTDLWLDPLDMGFVVQRSYEGVDDPEDVYQDDEGVWHIKAGARVRVNLTMVADNRRYHVALADPLPAGLEIVNPALAVSGNVPQDPSSSGYRYGWWWWGTWYQHQNMRDERAEAFTALLWDGVYHYSYVARATTPGTFVVPPAKAEEMYSPEVFGRSASDWVIVE